MRLIDGDLLESNLREKAKEMEPHWTVMARAYEDSADMVHNMPGVPYEKQDMVDGMVRMFNMGYQMGKEQRDD